MPQFLLSAAALCRRFQEDGLATKRETPTQKTYERLYRIHRWAVERIEGLASRMPIEERQTAGGLSDSAVAMAPYDARWPQQFEALDQSIRALLGERSCTIHHIGSTAVPGLSAKPIVDCAVIVAPSMLANGFDSIRDALQQGGFTYRGEFGGGRYFSKDTEGGRVASAQFHPTGSVEVERLLRFRDHLRHSPEFLARYLRVKKALASAFSRNRGLYFWFKGHWIRDTLMPEPSVQAWGDWFFETEHPSMKSLAARFRPKR